MEIDELKEKWSEAYQSVKVIIEENDERIQIFERDRENALIERDFSSLIGNIDR